MTNENKTLFSLNKKGEILIHGLHRNTASKYKPDTPFDNGVAPYIVMLLCATVDAVVFHSLFSKISYDSPFLLIIQITGFLFGFDIVPIFIGMQYRRMKQGINKDKLVLIAGISVFVLSVILNIILRATTIDMMSPDMSSSSISYFGTAASESISSTADATDPIALALAVFGMFIPVVTSVGSFFVSYLTYDPLKIRKQRLEESIIDTRDEIRRLEAIVKEYDSNPDFASQMVSDDEGKYVEMQKLNRAVVAGYADYVRTQLKAHIGNAVSHNILSKDVCISLLERLERELKALDELEESASVAVTRRSNHDEIELLSVSNETAA